MADRSLFPWSFPHQHFRRLHYIKTFAQHRQIFMVIYSIDKGRRPLSGPFSINIQQILRDNVHP